MSHGPNAATSLPSGPDDRRGPPTLETLEDADKLNEIRIADLMGDASRIALALERCNELAPCGQVICAKCSCRYRRHPIREMVRLAKSRQGSHQIATIHLETIPVGSLEGVSIKRVQNRLRKQLQRCGFAGSILVGGIEVGWDQENQSWILHVHLLAIGVLEEAWTKLRIALSDSGTAIPLKRQALRNVERQVSYLSKFTTYHRPLSRRSDGRSRALPLPRARLVELARWWAQYRFEDFAFLFGAKRRGGRGIVPEGLKLKLREQ
jgi:hypothetical protein